MMLNLTIASVVLRNQYGLSSLQFQPRSNVRIDRSKFSRWFSSTLVGSYSVASVTRSSFSWVLRTALCLSREERNSVAFTTRQDWKGTNSKLVISGCSFRYCIGNKTDDGGSFASDSEEIICIDNAFVSCEAGYGGGFSWNGMTGTFERNCFVNCYSDYQMNALITKANSTCSLNYTSIHECSANQERPVSSGIYFVSGCGTGKVTFYYNNISRCQVSDIKSAGAFDHFISSRSSFVIYRNITCLRLLQAIGSSDSDTLEFENHHISYTKVGYTTRVPYLIDYEGHIILSNCVFFHNQRKIRFAHMRHINRYINSTLTVTGCIFDRAIDIPANVTWGSGNVDNVEKPPPEFSFDAVKCYTDAHRTPPPTATAEATPTESPRQSDLPTPSPPSVAVATAEAHEEREESSSYSTADILQVGGLVFLLVVTLMVFISARNAKERKLRNEEERAAFIIHEREDQHDSVL